MVFVLHFRFRQRRIVVDAPVDRLASAVDVSLFHEIQESTGDGGFVRVAHGEVGIVPPAEDTQSLEIALVLLDVAGGIVPAPLAELRRGNLAFSAELFLHLCLNRQTMAIPARNIGRIVARHALGLDDQVFQRLIQPGAEMNGSRGIGRPIMEHKKRLALAGFQDTLVQVRLFPGGELLRLVLRKACLHGEIGLGQVKGLLEFQWFSHVCGVPVSLLRRPIAGDLKRSKALVARRETTESGVTTYVTMKASRCQPGDRATFPALRES